jgi:hypothetical protein
MRVLLLRLKGEQGILIKKYKYPLQQSRAFDDVPRQVKSSLAENNGFEAI